MAWCKAWLRIARSTLFFAIGGSSISPSRYSRFLNPCFFASCDPNSTIFGELSMAITLRARFASNCERVPSPAPRSATVNGGSNVISEFIEVFPRLILPLLEHKLQTCAIARAFGQFARQESSNLRHAFTLCVLPMVVRAVINILSDAAIGYHPGPLQLSEMTRDARLAHPENLLQFSDRQFFLFEKQQQPQTCRIRKQPQQINS